MALDRYIDRERPQLPGSLFLDRSRRPLSPDGIRIVIRTLAAAAGVEASSHDFRRAVATRMLDAGTDTDSVAAQLGHTTLAMTYMYAREGRAQRAVAAFHHFDRLEQDRERSTRSRNRRTA